MQTVRSDSVHSLLCQLLELLRHRAWAELVVLAENVLASSLACNAAENNAVQQGVSTEAVVAVDAARDLASGVEARNPLTCAADALGVDSHLETAHAVVDHWRDDGHMEL